MMMSPQVLQRRRRQRCAGTYDDIGVSLLITRHCSSRSVLLRAECCTARRLPKVQLEPPYHLWRQADFRHQFQRAAAQFQRALDEL